VTRYTYIPHLASIRSYHPDAHSGRTHGRKDGIHYHSPFDEASGNKYIHLQILRNWQRFNHSVLLNIFIFQSVFEKGCFDMLPVYIKYMGHFYNSIKKKVDCICTLSFSDLVTYWGYQVKNTSTLTITILSSPQALVARTYYPPFF
jgi:hypothetical protein